MANFDNFSFHISKFSFLCCNIQSSLRDWISTCLFLMKVWSDRGSTCKFRKCAKRFSKFTRGSSVASYLHEKQTSRIQSLYLYFNYFIKIVPFWLRNIRFLIQNTRSLFYGCHYSPLHRLMSLQRKLNVKIFLMFIAAENTGSVNISLSHFYFKAYTMSKYLLFLCIFWGSCDFQRRIYIYQKDIFIIKGCPKKYHEWMFSCWNLKNITL